MTPDAQKDRVIAAIGYLSFLCFIPLFLRKDSDFAQFHGKQGFALFAISIAIWIASWLPVIGWAIYVLGGIGLLVLIVLGIVHAWQGEKWELPYIGKYAKDLTF